MTKILETGAAFAAWTALTAAAQAATPSAAPAAAPFAGPVLPGVCLLAQEVVVTNAKVGQAATVRLRELAQAAGGPLATERQAIADEAKALGSGKAKLPAAQFQQRQQALAQQVQAFEVKAAELQRQVEATRDKALARIGQDERPVVEAVYKAHGCSVLFARSAVLAGGQGMDLTPAVVQGLDGRVSTITFDLEPLSAAQAQAAAR